VTDLGHGKTRWGSALFRFDARRRLERAFSCCLVSGLARLRSHLERGPAILGLNHVSFWDGFLLPQLEHAASADGYCLMDRANLERLSFLRFAGAVPVDTRSPQRSRVDLERAARLLDRPGRLLFVFPQGRQAPARLPLRFRSGVLDLATRSGAPIVPVGLGYDFGQDAKPEVRIAIGAPTRLQGSRRSQLRGLEEAVRAELDRIDAHLTGATVGDDFQSLISARPRGLPMGTRLLEGWPFRRPV